MTIEHVLVVGDDVHHTHVTCPALATADPVPIVAAESDRRLCGQCARCDPDPPGNQRGPCPLCGLVVQDRPAHIRHDCVVARADRRQRGLPPQGYRGRRAPGRR